MKPRTLRLIGTLFVAFAAFTLMFRIFGGEELTLLPWPVAVIGIALGVFFLQQGGLFRPLRRGADRS